MATKKPAPKGVAAAIVAACVIAAPMVMRWEGTVYRTYPDPIQILTSCTGHTGPELKLGQTFTPQQCSDQLDKDLRKHAEGVAQCTPMIFERPQIAAAAVSFTYNVGIGAYCNSSAAKLFRLGNYRDGCAALGRYIYAGHKVLPGLVKRRADEVRLCLSGVGE